MVKVIFLMHKLMEEFLYMYSLESFVHSRPINPVAPLEGVQLRSTEVQVDMRSGAILVYGFPKQEGSCCIAIVCCTVMHPKLYTDFTLECANTYRHSQDDMVTNV